MPGLITNKDGNFESSLDNVAEELVWVKKQIQRELTDLQKDVQEDQIKKSFFDKKPDKVEYHMDLVKNYLQSCVQKDEFQINSAVVMAVQIALESKGYEVGKIDGLLKNGKGTLSMTEQAIRKFQKENSLRVDGVPGKNTVKKILEKLGNISSTSKKIEKNNSKGNDDLEKEIKELDIKQDDLIKLYALEIYRGNKYMSSDVEIKRKGYNPKDVRDLVKNKEEMERLDKIMPKNLRHEQATEFLDTHKFNEETDKEYTKGESKKSKEKVSEKPIEKKGDIKGDNKLEESEKRMDNLYIANKNIEPIFHEKNSYYLVNRQEFIDGADIWLGPKLKAETSDQLGGIGSSMMQGFRRSFKKMDGVNSATTRNNNRFWKDGEKGVLDQNKLKNYCEKNGIKSFVFYFGGNEAANSVPAVKNAYEDIKLMGEYLSSIGVQPVLCTCIGEKRKEHSVGHNGKIYPLADSPDGEPGFNTKIRNLGKEKGWPVIDYASIDVGNVWYERPTDTHPSGAYYDMRKKINEQLPNKN